MLICYDDTYWQYPRLAALHNVDVVAWLSSSDRVTPGTPAAEAKGDHSTVATVQHIAAFNGVWLVAATRDGIEKNPLTGQALYYNGGSSIWDPSGNKIAQAPVVLPEVLSPGAHGMIIAEVTPSLSTAVRNAVLARRGRKCTVCSHCIARLPTRTQRLHLKKSWSKLSRGRCQTNLLLCFRNHHMAVCSCCRSCSPLEPTRVARPTRRPPNPAEALRSSAYARPQRPAEVILRELS